MAFKGIFPNPDAEFSVYINNAINYLNVAGNKSRLVLTPTANAQLTTALSLLSTANTGWNAVFALSQNPAMRTKTVTDTKNTLRDQLETALRTVYDDIPKSVLSPADRDTLGIGQQHSSGAPVPVPTSRPLAQVDTSQRLQHTISFVDSETPTSRAKPEGVRGCQIWYKVGSTVGDPRELTFAATDTRSPYVLQFDGADAGKMVYYWLRWENTRGEIGPWSDVVSATIGG
jgi:hypothetical protein